METITFNLSTLYSPSTVKKDVTSETKREMPKKCECDGCKKKLMISDLECKCKKYFCSTHRFATNHQCNYDYKTDGIKNLEKNLVKVVGEKIDKI